jgi:hypothetical protein
MKPSVTNQADPVGRSNVEAFALVELERELREKKTAKLRELRLLQQAAEPSPAAPPTTAKAKPTVVARMAEKARRRRG